MKKCVIYLLLSTIISGCGIKGGKEYIGRWVNVKYSNRTLDIEPNGEEFIVRDSGPSFADGKMETKNIPATYKNGQLYMASDFGNTTFAIDKTSGNLTNGEREYKKAR